MRKIERPIKEEWVILEGEGTDEMPEGTFLPRAFSEAQEKYITYLEQKVHNVKWSIWTKICENKDDSEINGDIIIDPDVIYSFLFKKP